MYFNAIFYGPRFAGNALLFLLIFIGFQTHSHATNLYVTSLEGSSIVKVDTSNLHVVTLFNTPAGADSLVFDSTGRIIYTDLYSGEVRRYDPNFNSDSLLAGGLNLPVDMVLEPGGNSLLVSEFNGGKIDRINLNTLSLSTLLSPGGEPEGLAYDSAGRLFANLGNRNGGSGAKYIAQIDPTTGAILFQSAGLDSADGLTYDPFTGKLYATSLYGGFIYSLDPNNLAQVSTFGNFSFPDGITTDSKGHLYIASRGDSHIYDYNLITKTQSQNAYIYGLDDLAPASGSGSNSTPEPCTFALFSILCLGGLSLIKRRRLL